MNNRHRLRSILLQSLYNLDILEFEKKSPREFVTYIGKDFLGISNFEPNEAVELLELLLKKRIVIDEIITKAAPEWPLSKITYIDRNILRLGLFELLFGDKKNVPSKVAINEAVELAKEFGGPKSHRFVNGVMGAVYRELGEPGKEQSTKQQKFDVPYEKMPIDQKGAAVVYSIDDSHVIRIGMVHDVFGYWTLSKGGIEEGETVEEGTVREIKEETDWSAVIEQKIGENEYIAYHPERGPVRKNVSYFLARSQYTTPRLEEDSGGLDDVRWFDLADLADLNIYDDVSQMLTKSIELILAQQTPSEDLETNDN